MSGHNFKLSEDIGLKTYDTTGRDSPWPKQFGNTMLIGPTRSGKSVLMAELMNEPLLNLRNKK